MLRRATVTAASWLERTVVGVAAEIAVRRLEGASDPQIYFPAAQLGTFSPYYAPKDLLVRAAGDQPSLAPSLERIVHAIDPGQAVSAMQPLADVVSAQTAPRRDQAAMLGVFATIAFVMAIVGLHGVLAYAVSGRTREIGVRMALGAKLSEVLMLFLRQGVLLGVLGAALAIPAAYAVARTLRALLFGVDAGDPATYAGASPSRS
jgi:putative ABC transport system permease protein